MVESLRSCSSVGHKHLDQARGHSINVSLFEPTEMVPVIDVEAVTHGSRSQGYVEVLTNRAHGPREANVIELQGGGDAL